MTTAAEALARFEGHDYSEDGPPVFVWHLHHEVLCEPLTEPIANRIAYIVSHKPQAEVETRLRLISPVVRGKVPAAYVKARAALDKVRAAYDKAWAARDKAWAALDKAGAALDKARAAYVKARAAAQPALEALHRTEHPDCPWDGRSIFPGGS
jgi:FAD/FMN-containing dehydrogenase